MNFIVLSSSRGTAFQSVIDALNDRSLTANCLGLIADQEDRGCIEKAQNASLPYRVVERGEHFEEQLLATIDELTTTYHLSPTTLVIALMGWMWILSPDFTKKFPGRIINVHPALLPKYGGEGMYGHHVHEAVLKAGDTESGMTIHVVDEGVDTGKILLQKTCDVKSDDTTETLQKRVQELEKEAYPEVLQMIEEHKINL